jgi:hypothetical protein
MFNCLFFDTEFLYTVIRLFQWSVCLVSRVLRRFQFLFHRVVIPLHVFDFILHSIICDRVVFYRCSDIVQCCVDVSRSFFLRFDFLSSRVNSFVQFIQCFTGTRTKTNGYGIVDYGVPISLQFIGSCSRFILLVFLHEILDEHVQYVKNDDIDR